MADTNKKYSEYSNESDEKSVEIQTNKPEESGEESSGGFDEESSGESEKFMTSKNMHYIANKLKDQLCLTTINKEFLSKIIEECNQIQKKYPNKTRHDLNKISIDHLYDIYSPQKKIKKFKDISDESYVYRPKAIFTNHGMYKSTSSSSTGAENFSNSTEGKFNRGNFFSSANITYVGAYGVWYNADTDVFFNPHLNWIYIPGSNAYYDAITSRKIEVSKGADISKMFSLKESIVNVGQPAMVKELSTGGGQLTAKQLTIKSQKEAKSKLMADIQYSREGRPIITKIYNITIDSKHRDLNSFPSASRYTIKFERKGTDSINQVGFINNIDSIIRNVRRIDLIKGIVPNIFKPNVNTPDNYLLLGLDEIIGQHYNSSPVGKNIFGRLQFDLRLPINTNFLHVDPIECYRTYTPEPLTTPIVSLTVNILNFNGNLYSFGQDAFLIRYWQSMGGITIITTWLPNGLSSGDRVIFRLTTNAKMDETFDGYIITVISPTVFTIIENSTTVSAGIAPNIGGPPVDIRNPLLSSGYPYPTIPPNDPLNPIDKFGYVLDLKKQNAFTFRILSEIKADTTQEDYAKILNY